MIQKVQSTPPLATKASIAAFEAELRFRGLKEASIYRYMRIVEMFAGSGKPLTRAGVIQFREEYLAKSTGTYQRWCMQVLKEYFEVSSILWPFRKSELPKTSRPSRPYFTEEKIGEFLKKASRNPLDHAILRVAAVLGCRREELVTTQKVDFKGSTLRIRTAKGGVERVRKLDPETSRVLRVYLESRKDESPALFVNEKGMPLTPDAISVRMRVYIKALGMPARTGLHAVRRGAVTWLYEAGMREKEIQELIGWKSPFMVHEYIQLVPGRLEDAAMERNPLTRERKG